MAACMRGTQTQDTRFAKNPALKYYMPDADNDICLMEHLSCPGTGYAGDLLAQLLNSEKNNNVN